MRAYLNRHASACGRRCAVRRRGLVYPNPYDAAQSALCHPF